MNRITFRDLGNKGRLGNQLFQIAATIAMGKRNDLDIVFPDWEYNPYLQNPLPCTYEVHPTHLYREETFHYDPIVLDRADLITDPYAGQGVLTYSLDGYFQSEKYFADCSEYIKSVFEMKSETLRELKKKYSRFLHYEVPACAIHVRRGDYVDNPYYEQLGIEYYTNAINEMRLHRKSGKYLIFSDDIDWCRHNMIHKAIPDRDRIFFVEGNDEFTDLTLMSLCDHFIIANSSFSWWGAYLGRHKDKHVIFPKKWFGPQVTHKDIKDLYFEGSSSIIS